MIQGKSSFKKIMIFGRPGSGKSTFSSQLSRDLKLPLYHLDKHFYTENWIERNYSEFLSIQQDIVNSDKWIVDGNCIRSFKMRWSEAELILYFNFPKIICYLRILKRFLRPNKMFDDRAPGCNETIRFSLLKYMWSFEQRVAQQILELKEKYANAIFVEMRNKIDLNKLKSQLLIDN